MKTWKDRKEKSEIICGEGVAEKKLLTIYIFPFLLLLCWVLEQELERRKGRFQILAVNYDRIFIHLKNTNLII
jgi:hypothetical protein